jgi:hypothetical protein
VSLNVIERQLGHANLGTTSIYLQGIDIEQPQLSVVPMEGEPDDRLCSARLRRAAPLTRDAPRFPLRAGSP